MLDICNNKTHIELGKGDTDIYTYIENGVGKVEFVEKNKDKELESTTSISIKFTSKESIGEFIDMLYNIKNNMK